MKVKTEVDKQQPGIERIEQLIRSLEDSQSQVEESQLSAVCAALATHLFVQPGEIALLKLGPRRESLRFVLPLNLQSSGVIPLESQVAVAARIFRERRPAILNDFAKQPHARVFEGTSFGSKSTGESIQKMLSVPLFRGQEPVALVEISRKGRTAAAAGRDFDASDVKRVEALNDLLVRLASVEKIDLVRTGPRPSPRESDAIQRRAPRLRIAIPVVTIYRGPDNRMVRQETQTFEVSAYGTGIMLQNPPQMNEALVLIHGKTEEEIYCRVASVRAVPKSSGFEVGLDFREARPKFWHIAFPPLDFDPRERKSYSRPK